MQYERSLTGVHFKQDGISGLFLPDTNNFTQSEPGGILIPKDLDTRREPGSFRRSDRVIESLRDIRTVGLLREAVAAGRVFHYRNSADIVSHSLNGTGDIDLQPRTLASGQKLYPTIAERKDGFSVHGMYKFIEGIIDYFNAAAKTGDYGDALAIVSGRGNGKTRFIDAMDAQLTSYTREHPTFAISTCPIRESAFKLLDGKIESLCNHCTDLIEQQGYNLDTIPVEPFSLRKGRGISYLQSAHTRYGNEASQQYIINALLRANQGVLFITEAMKHPMEMYYDYLDYLRGNDLGRRVQELTGNIESLDTVVILVTTEPEYDSKMEASDPALEPLRDRLWKIVSGLNTAAYAEKMIYNDALTKYNLQDIHSPPELLDELVRFAILTRLQEIDEKNGSMDWKIAHHNGQNILGLTEEERARFDGVKDHPLDGRQGVSPAVMREYIKREWGKAKNGMCVDPFSVIKGLAGLNYDGKVIGHERQKIYEKISGLIKQVNQRFEQWLKKKTRHAFMSGFEEKLQGEFETYIHMAQTWLEATRRMKDGLDEETIEKLRLDIKFLHDVEAKILGANVSSERNLTFRFEVTNQLRGLIKEDVRNGKQQLKLDSYFGNAYEKNGEYVYDTRSIAVVQLAGALEQIVEGQYDNPNALIISLVQSSSQGLTADHRKKREEAVSILKEQGVCCDHCAYKYITHVGKQLAQAS